MFLRYLVATLIPLSAGVATLAQEQVPPAMFLDQADGKTLTFRDYKSGSVVGVEHFLSRERSVWTTPDGRCTYGAVDTRGPYLCFVYEDAPLRDHCWLTFLYDGRLSVVSRDDYEMQQVTEISDEPLACEDVPLS